MCKALVSTSRACSRGACWSFRTTPTELPHAQAHRRGADRVPDGNCSSSSNLPMPFGGSAPRRRDRPGPRVDRGGRAVRHRPARPDPDPDRPRDHEPRGGPGGAARRRHRPRSPSRWTSRPRGRPGRRAADRRSRAVRADRGIRAARPDGGTVRGLREPALRAVHDGRAHRRQLEVAGAARGRPRGGGGARRRRARRPLAVGQAPQPELAAARSDRPQAAGRPDELRPHHGAAVRHPGAG